MSKQQAPAPPDPVATANAQTGSNISTAIANSTLGNINQVGPTGSTTFDQSGGYTDPTTGQFVPSYTETQSLTPTLSSVLSGTEGAANTLVNGTNGSPGVVQNLTNEIGNTAATPLNFNTGANSNYVNAGPQALDQTATNAVYNQQAGFLNPQWTQSQTDLQDQLSQQGIPVGSSAYNNAMTNFNNSKTQAYNAAANSATAQGNTDATNMFNMALQGQQQNVNQQVLNQTQPIQNLSALYATGTV